MSQKDKDNKYSTMVSKNNTVVDSCFCKPHTKNIGQGYNKQIELYKTSNN